jgi:hypothetical protein
MVNQEQFKALSRAIEDSFDQNELGSLLLRECGRRLDSLVALPMPWGPLVTQVLLRARQDDFVADLVLAVAAWRPRNVVLASVLRELTQSLGSVAGLAAPTAPTAAGAPPASALLALQGRVREASTYANFDQFLADLAAIGPRVCRIEAAGDSDAACGTGFLVGDDLVLTHFHVRQILLQQGQLPACRFDYRQLAGSLGVRPGQLVAVQDPQNPWLAWREYAPSDVADGGTQPGAQQLDYALLRLAEPVGRFPPGRDDNAGATQARGHFVLDPKAAPLKAGEDLVVVQHPKGAPLKLAMGSVLASSIPLRCAHDAPTASGTSGSPCFDLQLRLRALHHATDPLDPQRPRFNQAVPIGLIAADLAAQGQL